MRTRVFAGLPREVAVLAAVAFAVAVGFGVVAPGDPGVRPRVRGRRDGGRAVISAFAFARLVFALSSGKLVDRFGERVILATGIGIVAVSSALAGLAQSYLQLLLLRGIGGVGSAMFTVSAVSLLLRVVSADQRGRATGLWQSGFLLGAIAGPAIGGPLTAISLRAPFFVYAGTLAVAGGIGMVFLSKAELHEKPTGEEPPTAPRTTLPGGVARVGLPGRVDGEPRHRLGAVRRTQLTHPALRGRRAGPVRRPGPASASSCPPRRRVCCCCRSGGSPTRPGDVRR